MSMAEVASEKNTVAQFLKENRPKLNWHFTTACNFKCRYCFIDAARNVKLPEYLAALERLVPYFSEINFVGGEPTNDSRTLLTLMRRTRELGMRCSMVTNGYNMIHRPEEFDEILSLCDCVGISVDSLSSETNRSIGRQHARQVITFDEYVGICRRIKSAGCRLKINTVVSALNQDEDMSDFFREVNPDRIKLFQIKPSMRKGYGELLISAEEYRSFVARHREFCERMVCEDNDLMVDAYYMLNSECRFISDCSHQENRKSPSIADPSTDMEEALDYLTVSQDKYEKRY